MNFNEVKFSVGQLCKLQPANKYTYLYTLALAGSRQKIVIYNPIYKC